MEKAFLPSTLILEIANFCDAPTLGSLRSTSRDIYNDIVHYERSICTRAAEHSYSDWELKFFTKYQAGYASFEKFFLLPKRLTIARRLSSLLAESLGQRLGFIDELDDQWIPNAGVKAWGMHWQVFDIIERNEGRLHNALSTCQQYLTDLDMEEMWSFELIIWNLDNAFENCRFESRAWDLDDDDDRLIVPYSWTNWFAL